MGYLRAIFIPASSTDYINARFFMFGPVPPVYKFYRTCIFCSATPNSIDSGFAGRNLVDLEVEERAVCCGKR